MTKVQKSRIRKLANFLVGPVVAAEKKTGRTKFYMGRWCGWNNQEAHDKVAAGELPESPRQVGLTEEFCNTSACALGWATAVFPRLITLTRRGYVRLTKDSHSGPEEVAKKLFGMTEDQCYIAFSCGTPRTPRQEAAILRRMARNG